jgi:methyl-accepting chemotaxis protein
MPSSRSAAARRPGSIAHKLMLGTAAIALLCFGLTAFLIYRQASASLIDASRQTMTSEANAEARQVAADLGTAFASNDAMVEAVLAQRARGDVPDRASLAAVLGEQLRTHPEWLGKSTMWEADAFDGKDAEFANTEMHDATGRYMSYWAWHDGKPQQSTMTDYTEAADGSADWYMVPSRDKLPKVSEPYAYDIAGQQVLMSTLSTPIVENGRFLGVFTVDFSLAALQKHLATLKPMGAGRVELLSPNGVVLASANAAEIGKPRSDALTRSMLADIAADRRFEAFTPMRPATCASTCRCAWAMPAALRAGRGDAACGDRGRGAPAAVADAAGRRGGRADPQRRCLRAAAPPGDPPAGRSGARGR